jgi:hypothetical protein
VGWAGYIIFTRGEDKMVRKGDLVEIACTIRTYNTQLQAEEITDGALGVVVKSRTYKGERWLEVFAKDRLWTLKESGVRRVQQPVINYVVV